MPKKAAKKPSVKSAKPAKRPPRKRAAAAPRTETKPTPRKTKPAPSETTAPKTAATPETDSLIVATRADVARELKARIGKGSVRSLADWFKIGCPGVPGAYNVDEIEAWYQDNIGCEDDEDDQSERAYWQTVKIREQALKAQSERLQVDGALVETEIVNALIERLANTMTTMLGQWPDWILSLLPSGLKAAQRATIRKAVAAKVDEMGSMTADILEEWAAQT